MKKTINMIFFLCNILVFSQEITFIKYNVKIANEDIFNNNQYLRNSFDKAISESNSLKFGLLCKNDSSFFYNIKELPSGDKLSFSKSSLLFVNYTGEIYQEKDSLYRYSNILNNNTYIKSSGKINWTFENEKKLIDGYECYKATSEYIVKNIKGEFRHPVIAWYCPQLPFSFGPKGYGGLPGLILELQERNVTFGVETIDFNSEKDFGINKKTMKILSEEQYKEALNKFNDFNAEK